MKAPPTLELLIPQGKTFSKVFRRASKPFVYAAIASITQGAPARIGTAAPHGLPHGWPVAVVSVKGMRQINAQNDPPASDDYRRCSVVDASTVEFNEVNSADFSAYTSGGFLQFLTPVDLTNCQVRMTVRDRIGGTVLLQKDSSTLGGFVLDNTAKTITFTLTAAETAALTWVRGVYEIEFVSAGTVVTVLARGTVTVTPKEIAT